MTKFMKIATLLAAFVIAVPSLALAFETHGDLSGSLGVQANNEAQANAEFSSGLHLGLNQPKNHENGKPDNDRDDNEELSEQNRITVTGKVTAVSSTGFTIVTQNAGTFTVDAQNATVREAFGGTVSLQDIVVGDNATVRGTVSGTTITAKTVVITPPNTHPAFVVGTVTNVNGSRLTVQGHAHGVVFPVTVNTNASTTVMQNGTTTTSTVASIQIGAKVFIRGLWNEILNVLNAIKIRILK